MKHSLLVLTLLAALQVNAQTAVVTPNPLVMDVTCDLLRGSTIVARNVANNPAAIAAAVRADALSRGASGNYRCRAETPGVATYSAAPPPPPPPPPPPTGGYDVASRMAAFAARLAQERPGAWALPDLPAAPSITSQRVVSTAAEMQAAQAVAGVEVTFAGPGFVGTLAPRSNQRWVFPAGFTLTAPAGGIAISVDRADRVELVGTGGRAVGAFQARQVNDLRVRGMDIRTRTDSAQTWLDMNSVDVSQRVLIEGSFLFARSYGLIYSDNGSFVLANSEVHAAGEAATTRGARNGVTLLMDSRIVTSGSQQQVRQHAGSPRFAAFNLQIEGGTGAYFGSAGDGCPSVQDLVMLDNSYYGAGDTIFTDGCATGGVAVGNRGYSAWGGGAQISVNLAGVVRNNPRLAPQAPPPWSRR